MNGTGSGHTVTLNIHVPRDNIVQPMQFDTRMSIGEMCQSIREHLPIAIDHDRKQL